MRKLLLFLLLVLVAGGASSVFAEGSITVANCGNRSGSVIGLMSKGQCYDSAVSSLQAWEVSAGYSVTPPTASLTAQVFYRITPDGVVQGAVVMGRWYAPQGTQSCPSGQVPSSDGLRCVADPASVCAGRSGQSVTVTWTKGTASDKLVSDGCQVRLTGISVCVDLSSASPKCGGSGVFTGAVAPAGGVDASAPLPPAPANPKVTPGSTSTTTTGTTGGPPGVTTTTTKTGDLTESYSVNTLTSTATLTTHQAGTTTTVVNNVVVNNGPATESTTTTTETTGESTTKTDTLSFGAQGTGWGAGTSTGNGDGKSTGSTETTTTYPDGSTTGTCEGPACATSPNKPSTGEYGSSASCASEPWCKGDPVQCAQAREAWRTMCEIRRQSERIFGTEKENADAKAQLLQEKVDTKEELQDRVGVTEFDLSDYATFDETLFQASSACPSDKPLSIFGTTVVVSYGPFCDLADLVRPLVVLIATFFATTILYRSLSSKG